MEKARTALEATVSQAGEPCTIDMAIKLFLAQNKCKAPIRL